MQIDRSCSIVEQYLAYLITIKRVISKGNKERKIYMTPAVKQALSQWLPLRASKNVNTDALFISRN